MLTHGQSSTQPSLPADAAAATARILLVDDDELVRRSYTRLIRRLGYSPETAESGREAAGKLAAMDFDLVLSDISMPGMSGIELLRAVREHDLDVPVVLITGSPDLRTAVEAVEHGAFRYLTKPVVGDELVQVIQRALRMSQLARLRRAALDVVGAERGRAQGGELEERFAAGLDKLWMAFQPIVSWRGRCATGFEALVRSAEPSMAIPPDLFDAAEKLGRLHDLGRAIRAAVARAAAEAPAGALLFVNLHAADLDDPELFAPEAPLTALAPRVILEITERVSLDGIQGLGARIGRLRELGYRLAVDDLGAGYAGLSSLTQLDPEFVKLDRGLVNDIHRSPRKRSIVEAMLRLCRHQLGIEVIAEGIESPADRDVLAEAGCDLLQGFLFARPGRGFVNAQF